MKEATQKTCIHCGKDASLVPLVDISYQGKSFQICTQHFPILIHKPQELKDKLPGAESIPIAEHHD